MKKTLQVLRDVEYGPKYPAGNTVTLTLRDNYARCTGFFIVPYENNADMNGVTFGLRIDNQEVLPDGCDASLFLKNNNISRGEATYDLSKENIPARSSNVELTVKSQRIHGWFHIYFVLEN